ncbi:MAG: ribonuclease III [Acidobacteria bacterium]|jgi:ribonuclease-3|nr:ribonuclease III [Acidobacteriota bacterium]MDP7690562.1 ribonuclease III [Vicinamibacterales bacterium]HJN44214.1 ribonuclease III [Vicinamibacterales bacterium]
MTETDPAVVFRTQSEIEASVVKGLLETHGITAVLSTYGSHAILPVPLSAPGEARLTVRADDAERATRLIADFRREVSDRVTRIRDEFRAVEEVLGYRFTDGGLLEHALTHRSRAHEDASGGVRDNESLEFLGDAVLGFVIADRLFRECPDWDEGQKSKAKAMMVSTTALARVGDELGLGDYLLLGRGEEKTGGRRKRSLIADTFEAIVAAVYLDGGIEAARGFIERWFRPQLDAVRVGALAPGLTADHKSTLQERLRSRDMGLPQYRLVGETGPAHRKVFETEVRAGERPLARGEGFSKKESEQRAAERALQALARG